MPETFSDLPDALVRDLLAATGSVADEVKSRFESLRASRRQLREAANTGNLIRRKADLDVPREPSVVGIDGSYQMHRLTSLDLCASAAVAVEGTAKEAKRHWQEPYHRFWAGTVPHNDDSTMVLRGLMMAMELDLAGQAPHDLVLLDGSFASLIIYLNQGLSNVASVGAMGNELTHRCEAQGLIRQLIGVLRSDRVVAMPKYTSRNELLEKLSHPLTSPPDGRTLATLILEPGEYTEPLPVYCGGASAEPEEYHVHGCSPQEQQHMNEALQDVQAIYYRPFAWVPALRLEVPGAIAHSRLRLSSVLQGIVSQFFSPAVVEPYPLFLADRMVKSLGSGVQVMEQSIAQHVADSGPELELTMLLLQNYRTEGGRGGT